MNRKDKIDAFGAAALTGFALLIAFNQVVIRVTNEGLQPVFFAALRSLGAMFLLAGWIWLRGIPFHIPRRAWGAAIAIGVVFGLEFVFLFTALDLTTVARTSVIFYTMPVWLAVAAHFLIPGERLTGLKALGLALCVAGVAYAIFARDPGDQEASLAGDLCALAGAILWAAIAYIAKATPLREVRPETQLLAQVTLSVPVLFLAAPFFGPFLRDPEFIHWAGLAFQIVVVVGFGFLLWLWLLSIYPAADVASFSFLSPLFGVGLGALLLNERVGPSLIVSIVMVVAGLVAITWRRPQVPQKVA